MSMPPTFDPTNHEDAREDRAGELDRIIDRARSPRPGKPEPKDEPMNEPLHELGLPDGSPFKALSHSTTCAMGRALRRSVGMECGHGYDVCPTCDPCTCQPCEVCQRVAPLIDGECPACRH